ncbi:microcompartments protein [Thermovirga lienii DSM 17291]|uniref:Microcompartments protein n=1 Tax=Thermovirga lienii (strain ATCC BAA-1197 / DSM 17291 / Cas60314) TaxID=580340 RepID=G7V6B6_THELD|nr:BMC domain-containing protein [Thermovirga lienii]AER65945.1 microcompartments protein [Thermovirga lienii DSM 17291]
MSDSHAAVGFIETVGLAAAIEAADAACKTANIKLIGRENSRGSGMITIKIRGEVSAVKSALLSAHAAASKVNKVVSVSIIPRPGAALEPVMVYNKETLSAEGQRKAEDEKESETKPQKEEKEQKTEKTSEAKETEAETEASKEEKEQKPVEPSEVKEVETEPKKEEKETLAEETKEDKPTKKTTRGKGKGRKKPSK